MYGIHIQLFSDSPENNERAVMRKEMRNITRQLRIGSADSDSRVLPASPETDIDEPQTQEEEEEEEQVEQVEVEKKKKPFARVITKFIDKWGKHLLDGYGESIDGPELRRKTWVGAIIATILRFVILGVIAYNIYQIVHPQRIDVSGELIDLNFLTGKSPEYMDIPTIQLRVSQTIQFYEKDASSLQRVLIHDMHGFEKTLTSQSLGEPEELPITRAAYTKASIPLNTFDLRTVQPLTTAAIYDGLWTDYLNTGSISASNLRTAQISPLVTDSLMLVYLDNGVFDPKKFEFSEHDVYTYFRFKSDELARVKPCQLQVGMFNSIEAAVLSAEDEIDMRSYLTPEYMSKNLLKTLTTTSHSWAFDPRDLTRVKANLFSLKAEYTKDDLNNFRSQTAYGPDSINVPLREADVLGDQGDSAYQDWSYFINYVNNFRYTYEQYQCDYSESQQLESMSTFTEYTRVFLPKKTDTHLYLSFYTPDAYLMDILNTTSLPFYLILNSIAGLTEVVQVTEWLKFPTERGWGDTSFGKVRVVRDKPIDFWALEPSLALDEIQAALSQSPLLQPYDGAQWFCDPSWYNDGICDCNCGGWNYQDPDCALLMPQLFNKDPNELLRPSSGCAQTMFGGFCTKPGYCLNIPQLRVSNPCYSVTALPTDQIVSGFFGSNADFEADAKNYCSACPGDNYFNNQPQLSRASGEVACNFNPTGVIDLAFSFNDTFESYDLGWSSCYYITVRIPTGERSFPVGLQVEPFRLNYGMANYPSVSDYTVYHAKPVRKTKKNTFSGVLLGPSQYDYQELCVAVSGYNYTAMSIGYGRLLSFLGPSRTFVVVEPFFPDNPSSYFYTHWGGRFGKFFIDDSMSSFPVSFSLEKDPVIGVNTIDQITVDVNGVVDIDLGGRIVQILYLARPPVNINELYAIGSSYEIVSLSPDRLCARSERYSDGRRFYAANFPEEVLIRRADMTRKDVLVLMKINSVTTIGNEEDICFQSAIPAKFSVGDYIETYYDLYRGITTPIAYATTANAEVSMAIGKRKAYLPSERYQQGTPSPDALESEVAMFVVPKKKSFSDETFNLVPSSAVDSYYGIPYDEESTFYKYSVKPGREHWVEMTQNLTEYSPEWVATNCKTAKDFEEYESYTTCALEMPPTYSLKFDHITVVNNKWSLAPKDVTAVKKLRDALTIEPEYHMYFQYEYVFQHDQTADTVQNQFLENMPDEGDLNQQKERVIYHGKMHYQGESAGNKKIPANSPIIELNLSFETCYKDFAAARDAIAAKKIFRPRVGSWRKLRRDRDSSLQHLQDLIASKWNDVDLAFDFTQVSAGREGQMLVLQPGYKYLLQAELNLFTNYTKGTFGFIDINSFSLVVVSTQVTQQPTEYYKRNRALLEFKIIFNDQSKRIINTVTYNIFSFLGALGSAVALSGYGLIVLKIVQIFFPPMSIILKIQKEDLQRKKKLKAKKRTNKIQKVEPVN